ncbi:hypothetical protein BpHYR1_011975 [Brachionus plicatilis]|uniref:Uncharacterized protein n=1 Tax=Brachionus plicatilis TaxID=10195 RepID=A0A3M7RZX8_BRAPC|nr:hypothetical protein BpHYR1_011975 [Brachionus plicatilis]
MSPILADDLTKKRQIVKRQLKLQSQKKMSDTGKLVLSSLSHLNIDWKQFSVVRLEINFRFWLLEKQIYFINESPRIKNRFYIQLDVCFVNKKKLTWHKITKRAHPIILCVLSNFL